MNAVDVSIVIATYRREQLVLQAVESALSQSGVNVEVIVVDDSPEGGAEKGVLGLGDARVRYLHRPIPSGGHPGAVRNDGVAISHGQLLHFLDDDDRLFEGSLRPLADAIMTSGSPMAFGRVVPFGDHARIREREQAYFEQVADASSQIRGRQWFAAQLLFRDMPFMNSACMITRDAFDAFGGYDSKLRCCEDVDLFLRVGRARGFAFVDRNVLHYRVGAPSIMNEFRRTEGAADRDMVFESYRKMHSRYKQTYGLFEYRMLQAFARATALPAVRKRLPRSRMPHLQAVV
jgi:glycosyltransferase involved in cell wall biosynthesis